MGACLVKIQHEASGLTVANRVQQAGMIGKHGKILNAAALMFSTSRCKRKISQ